MILQHPLVTSAKDGVLRVVTLGRISTPGQDPESVDAQHLDQDRWLEMNYSGPKGVRHYGEQVSGWVVDRDMMREVEDGMKAGDMDLILVAELREVYRNPHLQWQFVQDCLDTHIRFISVADGIDTASENWELMTHVAVMRHGMTVPEVRRRVRSKASYTFSRGGMVLKVKFGYRKLTKEQAESGEFGPKGLRIAKLPEDTRHIKEMARRLLKLASYPAIAEWAEDEGIPPGPYVQSGKWTGRLVKDLLSDPVLSGHRRFRRTRSTLVFATGHYRSDKNPEGPETQEYPELAHLTDAEHAEVMAIIRARAASSGTGGRKGKNHPLYRRPRKRSLWPGQHATCAYCGGLMYRYGSSLRCSNSMRGSSPRCWNHVQVDFNEARSAVMPWITGVLDQMPRFRETVVQSAWVEFQRSGQKRLRTGDSLEQRIAELDRQAQRLAKAVKVAGDIDELVQELSQVQSERTKALEQQEAQHAAGTVEAAFLSQQDVDERLDEALDHLARTSFEFADILRRLIPKFEIWAVQQLDRPQIRPRAKLTLRSPDAADGFEISATIDLFTPPLFIRHLRECVQSRPELSYAKIAALLGINRMVVKRALAYAQLMESSDSPEPYRELSGPPKQASRWRNGKRGETDGTGE